MSGDLNRFEGLVSIMRRFGTKDAAVTPDQLVKMHHTDVDWSAEDWQGQLEDYDYADDGWDSWYDNGWYGDEYEGIGSSSSSTGPVMAEPTESSSEELYGKKGKGRSSKGAPRGKPVGDGCAICGSKHHWKDECPANPSRIAEANLAIENDDWQVVE